MAQWLRLYTALLGDCSSGPTSMSVSSQLPMSPAPRNLTSFSGLQEFMCIYTQTRNTIQNKSNKITITFFPPFFLLFIFLSFFLRCSFTV